MAEVKRLLVLAGAAVADVDEVPETVRALIAAADQVFIVTPTLTSGLEWLMSDVDRARRAADERLATVLGQLEPRARVVGGSVGDDTPMTLVGDHVREFDPDHILIALRSQEHAGWQEEGLIDRIGTEFGIPVTVFAIDPDGRVTGERTQ